MESRGARRRRPLPRRGSAIVVPICAMAVVSLYCRALRWRVLVRPLAQVQRQSIFSATAMGFAANMLLPLRAGEVLRPWLLARREGLKLAPVVATVAVERLFDMATLLFFFGVATLTLPLPPEWRRYGWVFLGTFVAFLGVLGLLLRFPRETVGALDKVLTPLPEQSVGTDPASRPPVRRRARCPEKRVRRRSRDRLFARGLAHLGGDVRPRPFRTRSSGSPDPRCALADDDGGHRGRRSRWPGIHRHVSGGLRGGARRSMGSARASRSAIRCWCMCYSSPAPSCLVYTSSSRKTSR